MSLFWGRTLFVLRPPYFNFPDSVTASVISTLCATVSPSCIPIFPLGSFPFRLSHHIIGLPPDGLFLSSGHPGLHVCTEKSQSRRRRRTCAHAACTRRAAHASKTLRLVASTTTAGHSRKETERERRKENRRVTAADLSARAARPNEPYATRTAAANVFPPRHRRVGRACVHPAAAPGPRPPVTPVVAADDRQSS